MINWVIGGIIIAITVLIVIRSIVKFKSGKSGCDCRSCSMNCCDRRE
jgi:hypothetical protein